MPGESIIVDRPDILIVEGINVLAAEPAAARRQGDPVRLRLLRFLGLSATPTTPCWSNGTSSGSWGSGRPAFRDPRSYFRQYADLDDEEAEATARSIWRQHQSRQSAREYPSDSSARRPLVDERREPPHRGSGAAETVSRKTVRSIFALCGLGLLLCLPPRRRRRRAASLPRQGSEWYRRDWPRPGPGARTISSTRTASSGGSTSRDSQPSYLYGTIHSTDDIGDRAGAPGGGADRRRQGRGDGARRPHGRRRKGERRRGHAGQGARSRPRHFRRCASGGPRGNRKARRRSGLSQRIRPPPETLVPGAADGYRRSARRRGRRSICRRSTSLSPSRPDASGVKVVGTRDGRRADRCDFGDAPAARGGPARVRRARARR